MSEFEFISVFVSIVLAFAMAELLMSWGRLIRAHDESSQTMLFYRLDHLVTAVDVLSLPGHLGVPGG